jgi:hypothetical protein
MCLNPDELKAFALVHDPDRGILYEVDAQPTGSTVRMTNLAARVDDPAGVTRMDVSKAAATLNLVKHGVAVDDLASEAEFGKLGTAPQ